MRSHPGGSRSGGGRSGGGGSSRSNSANRSRSSNDEEIFMVHSGRTRFPRI